MNQNFLFFLLLSLCLGYTSLSIIFVLYFKIKKRFIICFFYFFLFFTIKIVSCNLFSFVINIQFLDQSIKFILLYIKILSEILMFLFLLLFIHSIFDRQNKILNFLFFVSTIVVFSIRFIFISTHYENQAVIFSGNYFWLYLPDFFITFLIIYIIIYGIIHYKYLKNKSIKTLLKQLLLYCIVFLPLFILFKVEEFSRLSPIYILFAFFYSGLGLIFTINLIRYYFRHVQKYSQINLDDELLSQYSLTNAEVEILKLLMAGFSNREVSENLNLSRKMILHSLRSIFLKTNTNSCWEIFNLLYKQKQGK